MLTLADYWEMPNRLVDDLSVLADVIAYRRSAAGIAEAKIAEEFNRRMQHGG